MILLIVVHELNIKKLNPDPNLVSCIGELDGIRQEVQKNLHVPVLVTKYALQDPLCLILR